MRDLKAGGRVVVGDRGREYCADSGLTDDRRDDAPGRAKMQSRT